MYLIFKGFRIELEKLNYMYVSTQHYFELMLT